MPPELNEVVEDTTGSEGQEVSSVDDAFNAALGVYNLTPDNFDMQDGQVQINEDEEVEDITEETKPSPLQNVLQTRKQQQEQQQLVSTIKQLQDQLNGTNEEKNKPVYDLTGLKEAFEDFLDDEQTEKVTKVFDTALSSIVKTMEEKYGSVQSEFKAQQGAMALVTNMASRYGSKDSLYTFPQMVENVKAARDYFTDDAVGNLDDNNLLELAELMPFISKLHEDHGDKLNNASDEQIVRAALILKQQYLDANKNSTSKDNKSKGTTRKVNNNVTMPKITKREVQTSSSERGNNMGMNNEVDFSKQRDKIQTLDDAVNLAFAQATGSN